MRKISDLFNTCEESYNEFSPEGDEESDSFHRPKRTSKVIVGRLVLKEEVVQESWSSQQAANCVVSGAVRVLTVT